jgi:DNA modification methylase
MDKMRSKSDKRTIEYVGTSSLTPYARNSRTHAPEQVKQIAASIREFGFTNPVLIDDEGTIIAGHGRVLAAQHLQLAEVPCIRLGYLTETQRRAYVIADNKLALNAGWDEELLKLELEDLHLENFDLGKIGFDAKELSEAMGLDDKEIVEDEVPEPPADPITKPGDLWLLGEHRLLCGDSTKAEDVERLMAGAKADACVTDPPYNINYGNIKHPKSKSREIANDNMSAQDFRAFCERFAAGIASHCVGCVYCFGPPGADGRIMFAVLDVLFHCSTTIVWNKDQFTLGRGKYQNKYEPCWFGWVEDGSRFQDDRTRTNVWDFARPKASIEHPTMKPVSLIAECVSHSSPKGSRIYDPFLGSGTTLIAAEQLGRKCYGMEISPAYCDVIVKRWETFTGRKAELVNG